MTCTATVHCCNACEFAKIVALTVSGTVTKEAVFVFLLSVTTSLIAVSMPSLPQTTRFPFPMPRSVSITRYTVSSAVFGWPCRDVSLTCESSSLLV
ncbi:hypothetical protein L596_001234 [Steinernema carpocapsae]|uniref:Uncharacterized protein n=1 Tax=Steinernema carpocapsae TaxID=34508 RepID=A0A4U8UL72_STECR|nr:hypothetical protein L596_001234 [Steinernema carpocapsae]